MKRLQRGLANNKASKEGMTSTDTNNVKEGSRTFVPKRPLRTRAMNRSFDDAFKKVDDVAAPSSSARSKKSGRVFTQEPVQPWSLEGLLAPTTSPWRHWPLNGGDHVLYDISPRSLFYHGRWGSLGPKSLSFTPAVQVWWDNVHDRVVVWIGSF